MNSPHARADWLAIIIHGVCGLPIGVIAGLVIIHRRRAGVWLDEDLILPFLCGMAIAVAGFTAWQGDRFWRRGHQWILPIDAPHHSTFSRVLSLMMVALGLLFSAACMVCHFSRS